ncbi:MAG: hypothetical protein ACREAA_19980 [Candidatus Polarisedimenticolia bacterium]
MDSMRRPPAGEYVSVTAWSASGPRRSAGWPCFSGRGGDQSLSEAVTLRSMVYIGLSDTAEDFGVTLGIAARKRVGARAERPAD